MLLEEEEEVSLGSCSGLVGGSSRCVETGCSSLTLWSCSFFVEAEVESLSVVAVSSSGGFRVGSSEERGWAGSSSLGVMRLCLGEGIVEWLAVEGNCVLVVQACGKAPRGVGVSWVWLCG